MENLSRSIDISITSICSICKRKYVTLLSKCTKYSQEVIVINNNYYLYDTTIIITIINYYHL